MNKELKTFSTRYALTPQAPVSFYKKFFSNHLYKAYYGWLDKQFNKYEKNYLRAVNTGKKHFTKLKQTKNWKKEEHFKFRNVA